MTIDSLPPPLHPLIQEHYLDRYFEDSLQSKLGFQHRNWWMGIG